MTIFNPYEKQSSRVFMRRVFFTGSTAIKRGMGLCYDRDYTGTDDGEAATDPCELRDIRVELPSASNNLAFAGVAVKNYTANANGQWIDIYEPGSICHVAIGLDTVVNTTRLTCSASSADAGRFTHGGFVGRGSALALETNASGNVFSSLDGTATAAFSTVTTITKTGIGTACGYVDASVSPVDHWVVILGGADDTTGGDATLGELAVKGTYAVLTAPTADTITIAEDIHDCDVTLYVYSGNPLALCYLEDGEESGLQEYITPQDAVAVSAMVGGITRICGGYTMAADSTDTLADPIYPGLKKGFLGMGTLTTKDWKITATSGLIMGAATALTSIAFDAAGESAFLIGGIAVWRSIAGEGSTEA